MTDLETLARDLREAMHRHDGFPAEEIKKWREEPVLAWWLAVALPVQQLQREAWIAGRDAAAEAIQKQKLLFKNGRPIGCIHNDTIEENIITIQALEPPG